MKRKMTVISLTLIILLLPGCSTQSKTDGEAKPDEFIDIEEMDAVEIETDYGFKMLERDEFETLEGNNLKIRTNDKIAFLPSNVTDTIIRNQSNLTIIFSDVTGEGDHVYEDYLITMRIIIGSEEEAIGIQGDKIYNHIYTPFENATMKLKMPVEITDADKLSVYAYSLPDTGRRDKEFYYDKSDNSVTVNFSNEDKTIAVFYDEPPYNGVYVDDSSDSGVNIFIIIAIVVCLLIIIAVIYHFVYRKQK